MKTKVKNLSEMVSNQFNITEEEFGSYFTQRLNHSIDILFVNRSDVFRTSPEPRIDTRFL